MLAHTLESRWAVGHEPIVQVPKPEAEAALAPAVGTHSGLPLARAGGLKGMRVVNRSGESLGRVEELMLDVQHGRIAYAVMGSGGFFGLGERYFAIPWAALVMDPDGDCLVVDVARERFEWHGDTGEARDDDPAVLGTGLSGSTPAWQHL
jgi:sporulation protein YlmC with PRC-barrel domain